MEITTTLEEGKRLLSDIQKALNNYSTYFVDWEELALNKDYKIEYPKDLINAYIALKLLNCNIK